MTWSQAGETFVAFVTVEAGEHLELALAPGLRGMGSRPRVRMTR